MPITLTIDTHLTLTSPPCPPEVFAALRTWATERYVLENPLYWQARLHRRPCKHIPRQLVMATIEEERLVLPRGANLDLKKQLALLCPDELVTVVDHRAAPGLSQPVTLSVPLRHYQQVAVDQVALRRDGVVVAPTGSGKTMMAMGIIARLGLKALVVVHTRTLLDQTCAVIERTLGITPGRLGGGDDDVREVTVATVQTLSRRDPQVLRDAFGLVLLDEAHHCPAATFTDVLQGFAARHRVGLTATPERADELHPLMYATLGPELFRVKPGAMVDVGSLVAPVVVPVATSFRGGRVMDHGQMVTRLCDDPERNQEVVRTIQATRGRHALVLSERVQHCEELVQMLQERLIPAHLLVGHMAVEARQAAIAAFLTGPDAVLVATGSLLGEGFDCPDLDTLYLVVPSGNLTRTTQALGRVLRPSPGKPAPRVYDFVDALTPGLEKSFRKRLAVYARHRAEVQEPRPARSFTLAARLPGV
jgi:superfamily II DNA or RNA helicase